MCKKNKPRLYSAVDVSWGVCSSGSSAGHLVFGRLVVQSPSAFDILPNIPGQDINPKLLSNTSIGVSMLDRKHLCRA